MTLVVRKQVHADCDKCGRQEGIGATSEEYCLKLLRLEHWYIAPSDSIDPDVPPGTHLCKECKDAVIKTRIAANKGPLPA